MTESSAALSDDEILRALAATFPIEQVEPGATSLQHLAEAVALLRSPAPTAKVHWWARPRRLSPAFIAGAVVGVVGAGTGLSYAVGAPLPTAVRSIVRSVGLADPATPTATPVTGAPSVGPSVNAARQAEATLGHALTENHPTAGAISRDSSVLARRLAAFGDRPGSGASGTTAAGQRLLHEACRQLGGTGQWVATRRAGSSVTTNKAGGQCATSTTGAGSNPPGTDNSAVTVPSPTPDSGATAPAVQPQKGVSENPMRSAPSGGPGQSGGANRTSPTSLPTGPSADHNADGNAPGSPARSQRGPGTISHAGNPAG